MINNLIGTITEFLGSLGLSDVVAANIMQVFAYILVFLVSYIAYKLTVRLLRVVIIPMAAKSKTHFDDLLVKNRFFRRIAFLSPAIIIYFTTEHDLFIHQQVSMFLKDSATIFFYVIIVLVIDSVLSTINDYYNRFHIAKDHPIGGIIQVLKILVYIFAIIGVIGFLFDRNISSIFVGLGTLSAVLMLIFRDPILGFVGGLQLIFNKMLAIGDWITMPKYGADGTVMEINLTTVKIQNFDKTIITLPTYSLISGSFQNWRGMEVSGGRRIKRSVNIDMDSVKFCDKPMLEKFRKIDVLSDYIDRKEKEVSTYNTDNKIDPTVLVNGRRQTNFGVFRAYLKAYLRNRADINSNMTFLVRHLQPTEKGIPIQIYVFARTIDWAEYEGIQADIFDHVLAVVPEFGLRVFQFPSNSEVIKMMHGSDKL